MHSTFGFSHHLLAVVAVHLLIDGLALDDGVRIGQRFYTLLSLLVVTQSLAVAIRCDRSTGGRLFMGSRWFVDIVQRVEGEGDPDRGVVFWSDGHIPALSLVTAH